MVKPIKKQRCNHRDLQVCHQYQQDKIYIHTTFKYIELVMIIILILIKQVTGDGPTIRDVCSQKIFFLLDKMCCIKVAPGTYFSPSKVKQPANYLRPWSSFKVHLFLFVHYAITALNTYERFALVLEKVRTCSGLIFLIKCIDRGRTMTINNEFGSSPDRWHFIHHWPNLQGTSKSMGAAVSLIWRSTDDAMGSLTSDSDHKRE